MMDIIRQTPWTRMGTSIVLIELMEMLVATPGNTAGRAGTQTVWFLSSASMGQWRSKIPTTQMMKLSTLHNLTFKDS